MPQSRHALGLTLTRLKRSDEALAELRKATEFEPDSSQYAYVYAVALHSSGRPEEAMAVLEGSPEEPSQRSRAFCPRLLHSAARTAMQQPRSPMRERLAVITPDDRNLTKLN